MTKGEVINIIADKTGIDRADIAASMEAFFRIVKETMSDGENVYIRGFGSFINKKKAKKIARNIRTNTAIVVEEHYVPQFRPAKMFVKQIKESERLNATISNE